MTTAPQNLKISQLPPAGALALSDILPLVQAPGNVLTDVQATLADVQNLIAAGQGYVPPGAVGGTLAQALAGQLPDATAALNAACAFCAANGLMLLIDTVYFCKGTVQLGTSSLTTYFLPGQGQIVQGGSFVGVNALIGQASYAAPVSNVQIFYLNVYGDPTYTLSGTTFDLYCNDSLFYAPYINYYGNNGRSYSYAGSRNIWIAPRFANPKNSTGAGGFRCLGGDDNLVIGGFGISGDDCWQLVPATGGVLGQMSIRRNQFIGCNGESMFARLFLCGLVDQAGAVGVRTMNCAILDCSFIGVKGGGGQGHGALVRNKSGIFIGDITIGFCTLDCSGDFRLPAAIVVEGHPQTLVGTVSVTEFHVLSPYGFAFQQIGLAGRLNIENCTFDAPHKPFVGNTTQAQTFGDGTLTLSVMQAAAIRNADVLGVPLVTGQIQQVTAAGTPAGGVVTLSTALLGAVAQGAPVFDYSSTTVPTSAAVSSGNRIPLLSVVNAYAVGDSVGLVYDDGTILSTAIAAVDADNSVVTITGTVAKLASAGNPFVDYALPSASATLSLQSVGGGYLKGSVVQANGGDACDLGLGVGGGQVVNNFCLANSEFRNIPPNNLGINCNQAVGCNNSDCVFTPTAGSTTSFAVRHNAAAISLLIDPGSTLAGSLTSGALSATLTSAMATNVAYIQIDSEIVLVTAGAGTTAIAIARAQLGTAAASHAASAAVAEAVVLGAAISTTGATAITLANPLPAGVSVIQIDSEILTVTAGWGTVNLTVLRAQFATSAATHALAAAVTGAQGAASDCVTTRADVSQMNNFGGTGPFAYAIGQGNWVRDTRGLDTSTLQRVGAAAFVYSDFAPLIRTTGGTVIATSLTLPALPPRYAFEYLVYYAAQGVTSFTLPAVAGWKNSSANNTTLNGAINNSVTAVTLAAAVPAASINIQVDSEVMTITGGAGTTSVTVTRGAGGTTAAAHSNGAAVIALPVLYAQGSAGYRFDPVLRVINQSTPVVNVA